MTRTEPTKEEIIQEAESIFNLIIEGLKDESITQVQLSRDIESYPASVDGFTVERFPSGFELITIRYLKKELAESPSIKTFDHAVGTIDLED